MRSVECRIRFYKSGTEGRRHEGTQGRGARNKGTAKTADGGRRPGIAVRDSARAKRHPRRDPGVAVFRGGVLTTSGLKAASSRLAAAQAAYSPDLLGRGGREGIFSPLSIFSFVSPLERAPEPECRLRQGVRSPLKRAVKQYDNETGDGRRVFLGLQGRG